MWFECSELNIYSFQTNPNSKFGMISHVAALQCIACALLPCQLFITTCVPITYVLICKIIWNLNSWLRQELVTKLIKAMRTGLRLVLNSTRSRSIFAQTVNNGWSVIARQQRKHRWRQLNKWLNRLIFPLDSNRNVFICLFSDKSLTIRCGVLSKTSLCSFHIVKFCTQRRMRMQMQMPCAFSSSLSLPVHYNMSNSTLNCSRCLAVR